MSQGTIFILSGPSGVGKNSIEKPLLKLLPNLKRAITATTRAIRKHEQDGVHYLFLSEDEFQEMIDADAFIEWATVHGNRYGTPVESVETVLNSGKHCLLIIDVQGALEIKEKMPEAITIFLAPEKLEYLEKHIRARGGASEEEIQTRLLTAGNELAQQDSFDYTTTSFEGDLHKSAKNIANIIENHKKAS